jgi:hypothetical protein
MLIMVRVIHKIQEVEVIKISVPVVVSSVPGRHCSKMLYNAQSEQGEKGEKLLQGM